MLADFDAEYLYPGGHAGQRRAGARRLEQPGPHRGQRGCGGAGERGRHLVSALVDFATPGRAAGQCHRCGCRAQLGIAVTTATLPMARCFYSLNGAARWTALGARHDASRCCSPQTPASASISGRTPTSMARCQRDHLPRLGPEQWHPWRLRRHDRQWRHHRVLQRGRARRPSRSTASTTRRPARMRPSRSTRMATYTFAAPIFGLAMSRAMPSSRRHHHHGPGERHPVLRCRRRGRRLLRWR